MAAKIKSTLINIAKLAGFIAACAFASFVAIAPLWLLASKTPRLYTALVLAAASIFIAYKIAKAAKKAGLKKSFFFALKALCVFAGIAGAAVSLIHWQRLFVILSLLAAALLFKTVGHIEKNASKRA